MSRAVIVLCVAFVGAGAAPVQGQTEAEVRAAVEAWFGADAESAAARARVAVWGDACVPSLRSLAESGLREERMAGDFAVGWKLVCVAGAVDSDRARDLLVDILDDRTRVAPEHALQQFRATLSPFLGADLRAALRRDDRFRPAVERFVDGSFVERSSVASIAAAMGWTDFVPTLETMLDDENLTVRTAAARAIESLTGQSPRVAAEPLSFPATREVEGLVVPTSHRLPIPRGRAWTSFTTWFDGRATGLDGGKRAIRRFDADLTPRSIVRVPRNAHAAWVVPASRRSPGRMMLLVSDEEHGGPTHAMALDAEGEELWSYRPRRAGIHDFAALYDGGGIAGVVLGPGGEEGVVALDLDGEELFRLPERHVLYGVRSHPELPGDVLLLCGSLELVHFDGAAPQVRSSNAPGARRPRDQERVFARSGALFPAADGSPAMIVAGTGESSRPVVARLDASLDVIWTARLPGRVAGLAMIEPPRGRPWFVAVAHSGDVVVFDEKGTLSWRGRLSGADDSGGVQGTLDVAAGDAGDGTFVIVVRRTLGVEAYRFDPSARPG